MKKKNRLIKASLLFALFIAFGIWNNAWAASYYTNGAGTDWSTAANWNTDNHGVGTVSGVVPGAGDDVYIGDPMDLSASVSVNSVTIDVSTGTINLGVRTLTVTTNFTNTSGTGTVVLANANATTALSVSGNLVSNAAGTFNFAGINAKTLTVTGNITLNSGTLNLGTGAVSVGGTMTGSINTDASFPSDLTLATTAPVVLPAGVTDLNTLTISGTSNVTLSASLNITGGTPVTFSSTGTLILNGHTLTTSNNLTVGTGTIDARTASSALSVTGNIVSGTFNFTTATAKTLGVTGNITAGTINLASTAATIGGTIAAGTLTNTDAVTTLSLGGTGVTIPVGVTSLSGLTTTGTATVASSALATLTSISLNGTSQLTLTAATVTASGAVTVNAGTTLVISGIALSAGSLTGVGGTVTTSATTNLTLSGVGTFTLPASLATLHSLSITGNGAVSLAGNLALGFAGTSLDITGTGSLNIAGFNITLANVASVISAGSIYKVSNLGTTGAYITTAVAGTTQANIIATNIGVTAITGTAITGAVVRVYPEVAIVAAAPGNSVKRIYNIVYTGGGAISGLTLGFHVTGDLNGNATGTLKVYEASNIGFTTGVIFATTNTYAAGAAPIATVQCLNGLVGSSGKYYTMVSATSGVGTAGTKTAATGFWNDPTIWTPSGIPTSTSDVIIPTGVVVTVPGYDAFANSITINGTGSMVMTGAAPTITLSTGGSLIVNSTSASAFTTATSTGNAVITVPGNIQNTSTGTINLSSGTGAGTDFVVVNLQGTITNTGGGSIITNSAATYGTDFRFTGTTSVIMPADITNLYSLHVTKTGGASVTQGAADLTIAGTNTLAITSGIFNADPTSDLIVTGTTNIALGATLNANSPNSVLRTFTGVITLDGTLNSAGPNITNTITAAPLISASGILNVNYSITTFGATLAGTATGATVNALGSRVTFTGIVTWTNLNVNTNSNTNFTFNGDQTGAPLASTFIPAFTLHSLTLGNLATLAGDITCYGDFTNTAAMTFIIGTYNFTVYGTFNNPAGAFINATGSTVNIYGPVTSWGTATNTAFITTATTNLTIGGSGSLVALPAAALAIPSLGNITMNRVGVTLDLSALGFASIINTLTITSGKVLLPNFVNIVTTTTTIGTNGTLDLSGCITALNGITLTTGLSGAGSIIAANNTTAGAPLITIAAGCNYAFTGSITTDAFTNIAINSTQATDISLPSSIANLNLLTINRGALANTVTLNSNITLNGAITNTVFAVGTFVVNGYTLTLGSTYTSAVATNFILKGTASSSLVFVGAATLIANAITTDETTNLEFRTTPPVFVATIAKCNNLTIKNGAVVTMLADIEIYGNLSIAAAGPTSLVKGAFNLTVDGDVSNLGVLDISAAGTTTLKGSMQGIGTYTTSGVNTDIVIAGTSSEFQMPTGITLLNDLTLNRANGMSLNGALALGVAGTTGILTITKGDLDLNGNVLTLARVGGATSLISEAAGYTVVNTGASGSVNGYVTLTSTDPLDIIPSGIGVLTATGATALTVKRYPKTIPVPSIGLSTSRIFNIVNTGAITALTLQYDNSELNTDAANLKLYYSALDAFTTKTELTGTVNENTPITGKGNLTVTGISTIATGSTYNYALSGLPGNGGVLRTYAGADGGNWGVASNWSPTGVPSKVDQVVIGPYKVYLNGNGVTYECKSLLLNHANATLLPTDNLINGDLVSLRVMGNINLQVSGAEILGVNGTGRLNLIIGDGTTTGVSSAITVSNDYVPTSGIWVNNLTVNSADATLPTNYMRVSGNISLIANCAVQNCNLEMWGGYSTNQTIDVSSSSILKISNMKLDNNAVVSTSSNFELTNQFIIKNGSSYTANGGTTLFSNAGGLGTPWNVENGGTLKLWNVEFNSTAGTFLPLGTAYIQGSLYQYNAGIFAPTSGLVIMSNTGQREIVNTQAAAKLIFYDLQVAAGSSVVTSSDWEITSSIDVKTNASLTADNGTIYFVGAAPVTKWIKNASNHTLDFNNLTLNLGTVNTNDSWYIKGNLTSAGGSLVANNGAVTFENIQEKTIDNGGLGTFQFFKLVIATGSKVTTPIAVAANGNFSIKNNSTYPSDAGFEVQGTGAFYVGNTNQVVTFDAGIGVASGYPKTITNSASGRLDLGLLTIAATTNNEVTTASSFKITGSGATAFNNAGAGGNFDATAGSITFTGTTTPNITSVSPAVSIFSSIVIAGSTVLTFPNASQDIQVQGNIYAYGTSSLGFQNVANRVILNGTGQQIIGGTSTALNPIAFADLVIDKTDGTDVLMQINVVAGNAANHKLTLTNGVLNIGTQTLTVGAPIISRTNGAINGGTGTYIVSASHQTPLLEDVYFTINGTPTLYNLTVNFAHTTANDLTINGTLNLNTANLTIGNGASASSPVKLICNGNVARSTGIIAGDIALSRMILQGTGSVTNGLSNVYFGGTATTVQLEVARQETLGGNLNIANGSYLRINTGINNLNLSTNTLTFNGTTFNLVMISGGIYAVTGSSVVIVDPATLEIPATMFAGNECYNLTINNPIILDGDLTINGTLTGAYNITTNDNTLTFGSNAILPVFIETAHVIGNLQRTVKNTAVVFPIGDGTAGTYRPITLQFANSGSSQVIKITSKATDPTYGRGGNPTNSVDILWTITPQGTAPSDSIKAIFQWKSALDGGTTPTANASFPAKWSDSYWKDYRNNLSSFSIADPRVLTMTPYPISSSANLAGEWAVFNATTNTDVAKDKAIATDKNRIVITKIDPIPVIMNNAFKVTVQLQDRYGQPIVTSSAFEFSLTNAQGGGTFASFTGVIPAGQSYTTLSGLVYTGSGVNNQLKVDTTGSSVNWQPSESELFAVLPDLPSTQANTIVFSNVNATAMTIDWATGSGANDLVVIKADNLLTEDEFPVNGTTYIANSILGAGSSIGNASVIYNATGTSVNVSGLSPNTTYYVYVFTYNGANGNERYRTTAAAGNPKAQATTGTIDDDSSLGTNNTRATSKTIGTNTPVRGTIKTATDVDWFNFTVTNTSPNVRVKLYNLPVDYNVEMYNAAGERMRRSILTGTSTDAFIINNLTPGTYTIKIYGVSSIYDATNAYTLYVTTSKSEIFSVTP